MPLEFNGNTPRAITYNNQTVRNVYYNGNLVWTSNQITYTYTGNSTISDITYNGVQYKLLTLTSSGVLTFNKSVNVDIWACGGGSNGLKASDLGSQYGGAGPGGAGAYCKESDGVSITTINVTIGARNTASGTIITGDTSLTAAGVNKDRDGGTGGGGAYVDSTHRARAGTGDGKTKIPFGDSTNFQRHCAGGAGGIYFEYNARRFRNAGNGGTNGGNGSEAASNPTDSGTKATGGNRGGGEGGYWEYDSYAFWAGTKGGNASFYGSGGGGGGYGKAGGNGYQGVCYIRILKSDFEGVN